MTKKEYQTLILKMLGGSIVDIELESDIGDFIDLALMKVKPYIGTTKFMTVPVASIVDLTGKSVYAVVNVYKGDVPAGSNGVSRTVSDGALLFSANYANRIDPMLGIGSVDSVAVSLLTNQLVGAATGAPSDIDFIYKDYKLYLELTNAGVSTVTIEYVPDYQDVSEITDPYWSNFVFNVAMANTKIALGRARGKYRISNLPYEMDSDTLLSEGTSELEALMSKLEESNDIFYILD